MGATWITPPRDGRRAEVLGSRREFEPGRAVHRDIHQLRHPLGGDPAKDRGGRAGSPSGRALLWRLAVGAYPVAAVAKARSGVRTVPPGADRGPGRAALWNAPARIPGR